MELQYQVEQLQQENNELKAHVKKAVDCISYSGVHKSCEELSNFIMSTPKQSLNQVIKQAQVEVIENLHKYVVSKYPNGFLTSISEFKEQLKESN